VLPRSRRYRGSVSNITTTGLVEPFPSTYYTTSTTKYKRGKVKKRKKEENDNEKRNPKKGKEINIA
jgi:hypothetical protein